MAILHGVWLATNPTHPPIAETQLDLGNSEGSAPTTPAWSGRLFLWGETWRSAANIAESSLDGPLGYPLAMTRAELAEFLLKLAQQRQITLPPDALICCQSGSGQAVTFIRLLLTLPASNHQGRLFPGISLSLVPEAGDCASGDCASGNALQDEPLYLFPWQVEGLCLPPALALALLSSLPLQADLSQESFVGGDLRFWSHIGRWSADLLVRSKFLPRLSAFPQGAGGAEPGLSWQATWQPLLDSATDRKRFSELAQSLPHVCRFAPVEIASSPRQQFPSLPLPVAQRSLLKDFLQQAMSAQIRAAVDPELWLESQRQGLDPMAAQWLRGLVGPATVLETETPEQLVAVLENWIAPIQPSLLGQNQWRICFQLQPPAAREQSWQLQYQLQSVDHPQILVAAEVIWGTVQEELTVQGQTLVRPQETLLMGLGLASRVYLPIEISLQTARPCQLSLTPGQVYEFLKAGAWRLEDSGFGVILPPSLSQRQGWANRLGLKITAQSPGDQTLGLASLLNFKWELSIGGQTLSKAEFDRLVALGSPLVEINGEWVELRAQDVKAAQAFFGARKQQTGLSLEDALRLSTGDTLSLEKLPVVSFEASGSLRSLLATLTGNQTVEEVPTPPDFHGELRPYQARGVGWLVFLEQWGLGACLADDMGLGKTVELLAFLMHQRAMGQHRGPTLLVCPTSVLGNWEREVKRFAPQLKALVHHGPQRVQGKEFTSLAQSKDLVLTSYPLVYRDASSLESVTWQNLVLDEAQNIKNAEARQSQAVRQLPAQFRIALTGTPLENRLTELWSILDFLNPGYLGPKNFFQRRFATPIERYGDTASLQTLRSLVQPFILRRLKTDKEIIQDLPEKQEITVFCGLTPEQASLYEQVVQQSLTEIDSAEGIQRRGLILATLTKLKQICNHPAQFLGQIDSQQLDQQPEKQSQRSAKLRRLEEMLEEAVSEGDRALVFTQFAEMGKLLQQYLSRKLGQEALFLYGSTPKHQREAMVERFQQDPQGPRIFILSLKAGGVGLNLTRANHVFHFDRWWNPAVENQATDRVFRIGQTRNVQVHKFVCTGTLEEKIHEQIESKKALAEQVVGTGESWLTDLDTDQLRSLLLLDRNAVIDEAEE